MKKNYFKKQFFISLLALGSGLASAQLSVMDPIEGPSTVCSPPAPAQTFSASASNAPFAFQWSISSPSAGVVISNPTSSVTTITFPNTNLTYIVECTAINAFGESAPETMAVTVYETPTVTFSGSHIFCQGSPTHLSASPTIISASSTLSYHWSPSTGLNTTTGPDVIVNINSPVTYTVLLSIASCTNVAMLNANVQNCTGIETIGQSPDNFVAYPNPTNGEFILSSGRDEKVIITNDLGQAVRTVNLFADSETHVSGLPGGIYFVITSRARYKIIITE